MSQGVGDFVWKSFGLDGLRERNLTAKDAKKGREGRQGGATSPNAALKRRSSTVRRSL